MKVLHVITGLETGGAETLMYRLIKYFPASDVEHIVCSLSGRGTYGHRLLELGIPVHALKGRAISLLGELPSLVRRLEPDLIQGWMPHGNLAATFCWRNSPSQVPLLWNIRQSLVDLRYEKRGTALAIRMSAFLSGRPRAIIYNSYLGARQHEALGFPTDKRHVIDNGFDTDLFKPSLDARLKIRAQLGLADDIPLIGCVARLHPMKDHANFLRAARKVSSLQPKAIFILVGRNTESTQLARVICELGLKDNVRALGERSDTPAIMAALDILVLPSAWGEAFPNVVGEAMACGTPCVVTDVGDSGRIVGNTGIVVPSRDSDALARATVSLLQRPDRKALGHRARERIVTEFSLCAMTRNYSNLYAAIVRH